jgi:hypothetical protein
MSQTDRQRHLPRQTDSQHECEPVITYRFNIPPGLFARPGGRRSPYLLSRQGLKQRPRRLGPSGLVQSRLGKRLRYLLFGFPRPQMQGSRLPPGEGSPATAAAATRPPSLPPFSPSLPLPPSRAAARGALPRATCSGPNPGISEREKKERTSYVEKKRKEKNP